MKVTFYILSILFCFSGCSVKSDNYSIYRFDNGDDYVSDGTIRIVDPKTGLIGYATPQGQVIIKPQYAFGYPFDGGKAKVTYSGHSAPVPNSDGEYHSWQSNAWFYIDKKGTIVSPSVSK